MTDKTQMDSNHGIRYGIAPRGHRLPDEARLGPVRLQIADLERSLRYYEEVLGLRPLHREANSLTLGAHGDPRPLVVLEEHPGSTPVPRSGRLGLYHFAILLPSRADLGRFLGHLVSRGERAGASDHLVSEAVYLNDPDGLGIEVYADRPRSDWQTNGRELRMTTEPMHTAEVLAAAGGTEWQGMPAGTVVGHVHLHVGDLETAAELYHEALGLDRVVWSYPGALFLSAGGYHHHLGLNTWAASAPPAAEGDARLLEWTLELPYPAALEATAASLERAGYPAERAREDDLVTRDAWGTQLRIRTVRP